MRSKAILSLAALALVLAVPGFAQEAQGTLSMSLEECIVKALKDNLGVAIQVLGPEISAEGRQPGPGKIHPDPEPERPELEHGERVLLLHRFPGRQHDRQDAELHLPQRQPVPADRRHASASTSPATGRRRTRTATRSIPATARRCRSTSTSPCSRTSGSRSTAGRS